jgi:hypothetical protein
MRHRIAQLLKIAGIAIPLLGVLALVRWHPAWAIWLAVGFFCFNGVLVVILAIGWTILARRTAKFIEPEPSSQIIGEETDDLPMLPEHEENEEGDR